jgi:hypothetical protein
LGTKVLINFRSTHGGWYCNISYLVGRYWISDQFELLRVYNHKRKGTATDFNYGWWVSYQVMKF